MNRGIDQFPESGSREAGTIFDRLLEYTHRIDTLISQTEALIDAGAGIDECKVDGAAVGLSFQQYGHWKGLSLGRVVDSSDPDPTKDNPAHDSTQYVDLQRKTDGSSRVAFKNIMFDSNGNDYASDTFFEFSPHRPIVDYRGSGVLYDYTAKRSFHNPTLASQANILDSLDTLMSAVEYTVNDVMRQAVILQYEERLSGSAQEAFGYAGVKHRP